MLGQDLCPKLLGCSVAVFNSSDVPAIERRWIYADVTLRTYKIAIPIAKSGFSEILATALRTFLVPNAAI